MIQSGKTIAVERVILGELLTGRPVLVMSVRGNYTLRLDDPCDEWDPERIRPAMPVGEADVWYRGWEVGWDGGLACYSSEAWVAYKGGCDLDAPQLTAASWTEILDAIDDEEDDA